jgi:carboxylesterase type B
LLGEQGGNLRALIPGASVVIEGNIPGAFMPEEPLAMLEKGDLPNVEVLLGANQHEGSFVLAAAYLLKLGSGGLLNDTVYVNDHLIGDLLATWNIDDSENGGSITQALALGFLPEGPRTNFTAFTYQLIDMVSVLFLKAPILRTAEILSRRLPAVYLYSFEHYGQNSLYRTIFDLMEELIGNLLPIPPFAGGITHADDILYMFTQPLPQSTQDHEFSKIWCKFFTNFAATGTPTPSATGQYPLWPKFSVDEPYYMTVNITPSVSYYWPSSWRKGTPL